MNEIAGSIASASRQAAATPGNRPQRASGVHGTQDVMQTSAACARRPAQVDAAAPMVLNAPDVTSHSEQLESETGGKFLAISAPRLTARPDKSSSAAALIGPFNMKWICGESARHRSMRGRR